MRRILITGGAGSLGQALVRALLRRPTTETVVVASTDEFKHAQFAEALGHDPRVRFFIADVRDADRLRMALWGVEAVIHAAALKRIDAVSYDPDEIIKTNILGTANVLRAAIENGVRKVVVVSSDKAAASSTLYGTTKQAAEFIASQFNAYGVPRGTRSAAVRYGNVAWSRGSVLHLWSRQQAAGQPLTLTDTRMTRFWITMEQAVAFVLRALEIMQGGEVLIPVLPSASMVDVAAALAPGWPVKVVGLRGGGEKLHELLLSGDEAPRTRRDGDRLLLTPAMQSWAGPPWPGDPLPEGYQYASDTNPWQLSMAELRAMLHASRLEEAA